VRASRLTLVCLLLLLLAAIALTVSTYSSFDQTYDEPAHIAAGIQLLDTGRYDYDLWHGPLARLAVSVGPYLDGSRWHGEARLFDEGRAILYCCGKYERTLTLARIGNLPFLIVLIVVTWLWGRRVADNATGLLAAFFIAATPPILGNAAIATTDLAAAAMAAVALYALARWVERPSTGADWFLGAACALAVASKLSAVPFLVVAAAGLVLSMLILQPQALKQIVLQPRWQGYGIVILAGLVTLWLAYDMRLAPVAQLDPRIDPFVDRVAGHPGMLRDVAHFAADRIPVPIYLVKLPLGVRWASGMADRGHLTFLLGKTSMQGWWYYYPITLAVRTPIPLLVMGLAGLGLLGMCGWRTRSWQILFPAVTFGSILLFCMVFVRFNLGLRHVLILFPPLAIGAGYAIVMLLRASSASIAAKGLAAGAVCWQALTPIMVMPDQMTYFNAFAGSRPEKILIVADLDWGQDLKRLKAVLRERGISNVHLAFQGSNDLAREGLPAFEVLPEDMPVTGWVAISLAKKARAPAGFAWLDEFTPVERVGRSIDLYYIERPPRQSNGPL
jgi:4-amino-4-deoxy-L-arabinose transferase-like glycosyltransferase